MREFIYQESEKGCGIACLRMAMIEATGDKNYKYIRLEKHPPYNLKELQDLAAKEGGKLTFSKANSKECIYDSLSFPCLLLLKDEKSDHMVYVPKRDKDKLLIYDPQFGPNWIKIDEIKERWSLIVGNIEIFNKMKSPYSKPKIRSNTSIIGPIITTILSYACIYAAFYFMENNANYLISVGFLALYGILEIVGKTLMISSMKKFDEEWIDKISKNRRNLKESCIHYYSLKKVLYPDLLSVISSTVFALSILILFGLNNSMFFLSVALIIIYAFISQFIFEKKVTFRKKSLENAENSLFSAYSNEETITNSLQEISKESYRIGKLIGYEKIIYLMTIIMAALIPFINAKNITLNYYLLHLGGLYAIGESVRSLFGYLANKNEREKEVMYFYEYFYND